MTDILILSLWQVGGNTSIQGWKTRLADAQGMKAGQERDSQRPILGETRLYQLAA